MLIIPIRSSTSSSTVTTPLLGGIDHPTHVSPNPSPISVEEFRFEISPPELLLAKLEGYLVLVSTMDGGIQNKDLPHLLDAQTDSAAGTTTAAAAAQIEIGPNGRGLTGPDSARDASVLVGHGPSVGGRRPEVGLGYGPGPFDEVGVLRAKGRIGRQEGRSGIYI